MNISHSSALKIFTQKHHVSWLKDLVDVVSQTLKNFEGDHHLKEKKLVSL